jgi:tetratricopeptide (TPR) repeat protein/HEAT repeat protein
MVALGGTAFLVATLASPARADWAVRRTGNEALVGQIALGLMARPDDRQLATRLARLATKPALDRLLGEFGRRAAQRPNQVAPVLAYGQLLRAAGRTAAAAETFARAATAADPQEDDATNVTADKALRGAAFEGWAGTLQALGERAKSIGVCERALRFETNPARRRRLLHLLVASAGDPQEMEHELAARRELVVLEPHDDTTALALVETLERAGRPKEAAQLLEDRMGQLTSGNARRDLALRLRAAALYEGAGALDRAAEIVSEILRGLPRSDVEQRRGIWTRAIEIARRRGSLTDLEKSLAGPTQTRGAAEWASLSEVRDELGDLDGALQAARQAAAQQPRNLEIGRRVAALLDRLGKGDEVTAELAALARLAPSDPRFSIELIEREFRSARKEEARADLDRAIARFSASAAALGQLADLAGRWSESRRALDAWVRLLRLSPRDEMAILGLGEVQFQSHKKDQAIRTWQALRSGRTSKADGYARLAEVLMEHDLLEEATAEVLQAATLEPKAPRHRRLMAQILERQRRPEMAIAEWERVLMMNKGPDHAAERREARSRILGILSREGRTRLEERIVKLRAEVDQHPDDRETALFLAEAELRSDSINGAIETLRAILVRDRQTPTGKETGDDATGEITLTLVRLLRQTRQLDEAVRLLDDLATRSPSRAREAHIQIADIELGRYEDRQALEHASSAARLAPDDGRALIRIADVQERAGEIDSALANYRRAFGRDPTPAAAFALSRLLARKGSTSEAAAILRGLLRSAGDEETITETGRRAIDLEEYLGTLEDLERVVAGLLFSNPNGAAYRRLLVEIYRRVLPALYRAPIDAANAGENRAHIAQHGLRPLLELLTDSDSDPERGLIELLGMLGNRDAAPALARLAQGPAGGEALLRGSSGPSETQLAAIIALGRLSDGRARSTLESLLSSSDAALRIASVWALGRLTPAESGELLAANTSSHLDVAGFAYLGLGRTGDARWLPELTAAALEPTLPTKIRRAAAIALGLSRSRSATPALLALLDSGNDELARAAGAALGALGDTDVLPALFERALFGSRSLAGDDAPALAAIDRLVGGTPLEDEAKAIEGTRLDLDAMLNVLTALPAATDRTAAWIGRANEIEAIMERSLAGDRSHRVAALEALDARDDGPGLGGLAPTGATVLKPAAARALRRIGETLRPRVFALLDDAAPEVRGLALRVDAKLGDPDLIPAKIVSILGPSPLRLEPTALYAFKRSTGPHPSSQASVTRALSPLLTDPSSWARRLVAVGLLAPFGASFGMTGRPLLERALKDPSPFVRSAAVTALAIEAGTIPDLATLATDPVPGVRAAVARALARRKSPATEGILSRLRRDPSELVRRNAEHLEP